MDFLLERRRMMLCTEKDYIVFADSEVEQICATTWGDGVGLTYAQAARVTNLGTTFKNNTVITSFDELQYFTGLTYIYGSGSTESNASGAFYGCTSLVSVTLPSTVVSVASGSFYNCTSLEYINLGNLTTIGACAFYNAFSVASNIDVNCPNLTSLGRSAFNSSKIKKVSSLGNVTSITVGNTHSVFFKCEYLTEVVLHSSTTSLPSYIFCGCISLNKLNVIENIKTINERALVGVAFDSESLYLNELTSIGTWIWQGQQGVTRHATFKKLFLPKLVTTYGTSSANSGSFAGLTYLEYVDIGENITTIATRTFQSCSALKTLICRATTPPSLGANALTNTNASLKIYVPYGYGATYQAASGWSSYSSKIYELAQDGTIPV